MIIKKKEKDLIQKRIKEVWKLAKNKCKINFKFKKLHIYKNEELEEFEGFTVAGYVEESNLGTIHIAKNAIKNNLDEVLNDIIPHEVAHVFTYLSFKSKFRTGGFGHNKEWKKLCRYLGGRGSHYHKINF